MSDLPNVICRLVNLDVLVGSSAVYVYPPLGRIVGHPTIILQLYSYGQDTGQVDKVDVNR
jgi:hypothetical protein